MVAERLARAECRRKLQEDRARGILGPVDEFRRILAAAEGTPIPQLVEQAERDAIAEQAAMTTYPVPRAC